MRFVIPALVVSAVFALFIAMSPFTSAGSGAKAPAEEAKPAANLPILPPTRSAAAKGLAEGDLEPLNLSLPRPLFIGTPTELKDTTIDPFLSGKQRGAFYVKKGMQILSARARVRMSDENPLLGSADLVTDGDREGTDGNIVETAPGVQWVQIDLGKPREIWAIVLWHAFSTVRVYRDVVVQVSDDPDFINNVTTLFNNDQDNSSGLGLGREPEYIETNEGKLIDGRAVTARYIRCYSNGNTENGQNHYVEVEAWGR